jgi:hypothetical protein
MTKAELDHKNKLVQLGCIACLRIHGMHEPGPVQLHHMRSGGWGKGDYTTLIPLCYPHHMGKEGVHGLGTRGFAKFHGFDQQDLLNDTRALLRGQDEELQAVQKQMETA